MSIAVVDAMEPIEGFATLGARELARLTYSAERTARRWIRERQAPRLIVRYLQLMFRRPLGVLCQHWDGWSLRDGKLQTPEGEAFSPGEVRGIPLLHQQIAALERELRQAPHQPPEQRREHDELRPGIALGADSDRLDRLIAHAVRSALNDAGVSLPSSSSSDSAPRPARPASPVPPQR